MGVAVNELMEPTGTGCTDLMLIVAVDGLPSSAPEASVSVTLRLLPANQSAAFKSCTGTYLVAVSPLGKSTT